jgi:hypothetical protein
MQAQESLLLIDTEPAEPRNKHDGGEMTTPDTDLAAALELIGKQTDVVAVQLPEPDANIANPTWIIDEPGFGTQVRVNRDSIDGCVRWGPVRFEDTAEVREFAAALLAAANVADAAEDGGK